MANTIIKFCATTHDKIDQLPISNGQLIFVYDARQIYLDINGERTSYLQIMVLSNEEHRQQLKPVPGFYYVSSTHILWRYEENQWIQLTTTPREVVIFTDVLPDIGVEKTLYIKGEQMYRFGEGSYVELGVSCWETF